MPQFAPAPALDLRAYAVAGARLTLERIADERARIVATFPELIGSARAAVRRDRDFAPIDRHRAATQPRDGQRTCPHCGRAFTLSVSQRTALAKGHEPTACPRPRCKEKAKRAYMRAYFAQRRAAATSNGEAAS